ncbi:hypothetical protein KGQ20_29635 [Catenulispora sp. NF23]|uniref:DNA-binding protein n=1 Tax=Catenulispora pinistramenti TaxID=2705254 RepID=A0ABS5L3Z9_9ACTN|nr:hypothetical protein [Catenulispora pinistramenti]MBS2536933.1 hypothetical protein [Catenulispora pinistramenti]MBS2553044.1 hypothetical protein [Catenulispora pinistramenti]
MPSTAIWPDRLGPDHGAALANLLAGLTDHASAHRLGLSERTVQRRIRELMDWSGSGNRMQLGHRAALAGLPDPRGPGVAPNRPHPAVSTAVRVPLPDPEALRLLRLLLADAAAERTLNMSTSSIERRVRELMTLTGARSRAQLGWVTTRWGWLEPAGAAVGVGAVQPIGSVGAMQSGEAVQPGGVVRSGEETRPVEAVRQVPAPRTELQPVCVTATGGGRFGAVRQLGQSSALTTA